MTHSNLDPDRSRLKQVKLKDYKNV
jgi:hypothetical protein